jgi:MFS family permease
MRFADTLNSPNPRRNVTFAEGDACNLYATINMKIEGSNIIIKEDIWMTATNNQIVQKAGDLSVPQVNPQSWKILVLLCVAQFVNVFNNQSVQLILPALQQAFGFSLEQLQWVVSANVLAFGGGLLVAGRLADIFGHRRIFLYGLLCCAINLLIGGFSHAQWMLLLARTLQGVSTALMVPAALALLTDTFSGGNHCHRALGIGNAVGQLGGITGTLLGTALADNFGWPWVFFLNVPLVLVTLLLAPRWLKRSPRPIERVPIDLAGAILATCSIILLMAGLIQLVHPVVNFVILSGLFAGSLVLFLLFCFLEMHLQYPLIPLHIFRRPNLAGSCLVQLAFSANSGLFFFTLYMQQVRGFSSFLTGLAFLPTNLALISGACGSAKLIRWLGYKYALVVGLSLMVLSAISLTWISLTGSYLWTLLPGLLLLGVGHGIIGTTSLAAGIEQIPLSERGLASSLLNMSYQIGSAIGLVALVTLANLHTPRLPDSTHPSLAGMVVGFHWAFYGQIAFGLLGILFALLTIQKGFHEKR